MSIILDIGHKQCLNVLNEMYNAQIASFYPDDAMPKVMDKLNLSEEDTIQYVEFFLDQGLIKKPAHKASFFYRPGCIQSFPVTFTARGLSVVK